MPTLQSPSGNVLPAPATRDWAGLDLQPVSLRSEVVRLQSGRAPPPAIVTL
jgi:hypothetical protein